MTCSVRLTRDASAIGISPNVQDREQRPTATYVLSGRSAVGSVRGVCRVSYIGSARHHENLARARASIKSIECQWCSKKVHASAHKRHEGACSLNPANRRDCPVCGNQVLGRGITCSHACSNTHFRRGEDHPNWRPESYRSTCFLHHEKACVVCGESKIVEVHHLDGDARNNNPNNLIPLCPTHHQYWHSRYRSDIEGVVLSYVFDFAAGSSPAAQTNHRTTR